MRDFPCTARKVEYILLHIRHVVPICASKHGALDGSVMASEEQRRWQTNTGSAISGKFERFAKKHRTEFNSLFANLNKVIAILNAGNRLGAFKVGFFRSEGEGVYRIGQTGVRSAKESRIYVFPDETNWVMYILTIGDKDSQSGDINDAKRIARRLKADGHDRASESK